MRSERLQTLMSAGSTGRDVADLLTSSEPDPVVRMDAVRARFDRMSTHTQDRLAHQFPDLIGNVNGVPFRVRNLANLQRVMPALTDALYDMTDLVDYATASRAAGTRGWRRIRPETAREHVRVDERMKETGRLITFYTNLISPHNQGQLVYFNRAEPAGTIYLTGAIDARAKQATYFIPGAGTDKYAMAKQVKIAGGYADPDGRAPVIVVAPGQFPLGSRSLVGQAREAWKSAYAREISRQAAEFAPAVLQEFTAHGISPEIAVIGWCFGMTVVGPAQAPSTGQNPRLGLDAHRIIDAAGIGAGAGIWSADRLRRSDGSLPDLAAIVVDDDPFRAMGVFAHQHGVATSQLDGALTFPAGDYHADYALASLRGRPITGALGHGNLVWPGTDSFDAISALVRGDLPSIDVRPHDSIDRTYQVQRAARRAIGSVGGVGRRPDETRVVRAPEPGHPGGSRRI